MGSFPMHRSACRFRNRILPLAVAITAVLTVAACNQAPTTQTASAPAAPAPAGDALNRTATPPGGHPLSEGVTEEEYGEFLARPAELVGTPVNAIVKSIRMNAIAMNMGREIYAKHCASCHGEDLKGSKEAHAPDLTDMEWQFSGDDLESGGLTKLPSDVEWTIRYGVRSGNPNARGVEADMRSKR
jgi:mono/diheme cytochrome c family protein